jgi:hypothetical protein
MAGSARAMNMAATGYDEETSDYYCSDGRDDGGSDQAPHDVEAAFICEKSFLL